MSQQCHDVYNTVTALSRIVETFERRCSRPMFKPNSHQHRYGSEMLTRQGFPHIHNYCLCYKQEVPKKKAYATIQVFMYVTTAV